MAGEKPLFVDSYIAGADLNQKRYCAMKLDSAGKVVAAGAGEYSIGILQTPDDSGKVVSVMQLGVSFGKLGGTVANPGTNLTPDANGALVAAGEGDAILCYNLAGGVAGDLVPVCLIIRASAGITTVDSANCTYANTTSGLTADDVQAALDEIVAEVKDYVTLPVMIPALTAADNATLGQITPGFAGEIVKATFHVTTAVTTADKAADLSLTINAAAVTGGALGLTSANCATIGDQVASTAVTAGNVFDNNDVIKLVAANVSTPFIEGAGYALIWVKKSSI
jgi:hypothetical protein